MCPSLSAYSDSATHILMSVLVRHPSWGFTQNIQKDERNTRVIIALSQQALTNVCSLVKGCIRHSIGGGEKAGQVRAPQNILDLTNAIITKLESSRVVTTKTKVNVVMCARFAFLRSVYISIAAPESGNFWTTVDNKLQEIRDTIGGQDHRVTEHFPGVLEEDLKKFGNGKDEVLFDEDDLNDGLVEVAALANGTEARLGPAVDDDVE
ncbi:hypothetical protein QCA50_017779 [Cerrena zonata]|uniref:Uncharacterized protein n=1 Tax=Cerrena zonata TaxID=2478898 RepID=A0AAW0FPD3_9APHY